MWITGRLTIWFLVTLSAAVCFRAPRACGDEDEATATPIHFTRGSSETSVSGAVIRGERDLFSIGARSGQRLSVRIRSEESNAVFQVYAPGARAERRDYGLEISGKELVGQRVGQKGQKWLGMLSTTGTYLLVVGPTRGNASYCLTISVR